MLVLRRLPGLALWGLVAWAGYDAWQNFGPLCPECGLSGRPVRICYGFPTDETLARAWAGEVELGGCYHSLDDPCFCCKTCGTRWGGRGSPPKLLFRATAYWLAVTVVLIRSVEWAVGRLRRGPPPDRPVHNRADAGTGLRPRPRGSEDMADGLRG
jgi:hypothetical protein